MEVELARVPVGKVTMRPVIPLLLAYQTKDSSQLQMQQARFVTRMGCPDFRLYLVN